MLAMLAMLAMGAAAVAGCRSEPGAITGPPPPRDTVPVFAGFDIAIYPGDATMAAWKYPASPYQWSGYYLPAPCHRDTTWAGRRATLADMGWGIAAVYVGQQDWTQIPAPAAIADRAAPAPPGEAMRDLTSQIASCSSSLLGTSEGVLEADDAAAKVRADGFPPGSTVFLDVEYVTTVSAPLLDYVRGWTGEVLRAGYRPGVYAALANADVLYAAAASTSAAADGPAPPFWIASAAGFSLSSQPAAVGVSYAALWQGAFDVHRSFNGVTLTVDEDVASSRSPTTP